MDDFAMEFLNICERIYSGLSSSVVRRISGAAPDGKARRLRIPGL